MHGDRRESPKEARGPCTAPRCVMCVCALRAPTSDAPASGSASSGRDGMQWRDAPDALGASLMLWGGAGSVRTVATRGALFSCTRRRWRRMGGPEGGARRGVPRREGRRDLRWRRGRRATTLTELLVLPRGSRHDWFWSSRSSLTRSRNRCNAHSHSMGSIPCWCDRPRRYGTSVLAELVACYTPPAGVTRRRPGGGAGNREQRSSQRCGGRGVYWKVGWAALALHRRLRMGRH